MDQVSTNQLFGAFIGEKPVSDVEILAVLKTNGATAMIRQAVLLLFLDQMAADRGIVVADEELQIAADEFREKMSLEKRADMVAWMEQEGIDEDDFAGKLERDLRREKLRDSVIGDSEIERRFLSFRFSQQRICLSRIQVGNLGRAEEIRDQLMEGELDFQSAAIRYGEDEDDRRKSGYLDWRNRSDLDGALAGALFSAEAGDIVGPIELDGMFIIFKVWDIASVSFDNEVRSMLRDEIFSEWCQEQAGEARITIRRPA